MIKEFCYYYFWDKKLNSVAEIFISHANNINFSFSYHGHKFTCLQSYAIDKLFDEPHLVPVLSDVNNTDYSSFTGFYDILKSATMTYVIPTESYYDYEEVKSFYENAYDDAIGYLEDLV